MISFRNAYTVLNAQEMSRESRVLSHLVDSVEGVRTIKTFTYENIFFQNGLKKIQLWQDTILKLGNKENYQSALKTIVGGICETLILCIGAWQIMLDKLSIGELVTYNILIGYFTSPLKSIINLQPLYHSAKVAIERLESILTLKSEIEDSTANSIFDNNISFNNVSFTYSSGKNVLNSINMTIKKRQKIAIIGETGSGKTTLAKLLVKLYLPEYGTIYMDNKDILLINSHKLRKHIIYLSQEDFIFSETIKENLIMGNKNITDDEIFKISSLLGIDDSVSILPRAYENVLEERGENFSKGQKQKLAIGRALLQKPDILILDEATSNIDAKSERQILNYINSLEPLTVIMISHHLRTPEKYNRIYIMENGSIIDSGTHDELINTSKIYQSYSRMEGKI